jgi:hypothetical protein
VNFDREHDKRASRKRKFRPTAAGKSVLNRYNIGIFSVVFGTFSVFANRYFFGIFSGSFFTSAGDYDEISWNMIVSTTAESLSGGASAICEETEQTLKVKSSSYDDDISPPLSTQEILLISVVLPIGLTVCIFAIVCCCLKGNRCTMSKETEDIVHRSNQILKSRGGVPLPPRRDIPMNPVVPSNNTSASSSAYSNYSSSPMHTTSSSSPSGYGGSSTPSAPPAPGESDVLKNAFPEFYAKNQTTSYGYS